MEVTSAQCECLEKLRLKVDCELDRLRGDFRRKEIELIGPMMMKFTKLEQKMSTTHSDYNSKMKELQDSILLQEQTIGLIISSVQNLQNQDSGDRPFFTQADKTGIKVAKSVQGEEKSWLLNRIDFQIEQLEQLQNHVSSSMIVEDKRIDLDASQGSMRLEHLINKTDQILEEENEDRDDLEEPDDSQNSICTDKEEENKHPKINEPEMDLRKKDVFSYSMPLQKKLDNLKRNLNERMSFLNQAPKLIRDVDSMHSPDRHSNLVNQYVTSDHHQFKSQVPFYGQGSPGNTERQGGSSVEGNGIFKMDNSIISIKDREIPEMDEVSERSQDMPLQIVRANDTNSAGINIGVPTSSREKKLIPFKGQNKQGTEVLSERVPQNLQEENESCRKVFSNQSRGRLEVINQEVMNNLNKSGTSDLSSSKFHTSSMHSHKSFEQ